MKSKFTNKSTWLASLMLLLLAILSNAEKVFAQYPASSYSFTALPGAYTPITGGTAVTAVNTDDNTSGVINIGFDFNYCGIVYTQIKANANCWISFNTATNSTQWTNTLANLTTEQIKPGLLPFWDDVAGWVIGTNASAATYLTEGTAPNRVFTFQYKNWQFPRSGTTNPPTYNLQVKLYETTNVIEYIYERISTTVSGTSGVTIGICDGTTVPTYLSLNNATNAATASSTTFTTTINDLPVSGQIFRFSPPPNCSTVTTFPASATTTVTPVNVCVSQNVTLNFTPITPLPSVVGLTYQWQSAPAAAGPWTNVGVSTLPTYTTTTPINAPLFFRAQLLCNGNTVVMTSSNSAQVVIQNPGTPTVTPGARCGPGVVDLTAVPTSVGGTIRWFNTPTQIIPIATTNTYTTPYLTQNTTYYAATVQNGSNATYNVGLPNFIQTNNFITNLVGWGLRFTVTNVCNIDSVGVYPVGTGTIQMRIWDAGTQAVVYTGPVSQNITGTGTTMSMVGVGALNLPPGNYVMGIAAFTGLTALHNEGFNASAYPFTCPVLNITAGSQGFGGTGTPNVYYFSYNWKVSAIGGCEGPRVPVVATINPSPVVTKTLPEVVCNNSVAAISLTPPTPPYPSYNWTPTTNLYTDAAATIPYTGGSAPNIFMKTTNVGTQTYYMMAGNPFVTTGCTYADTIKVWVQPKDVVIKGNPDTICISGSSVLKLDTIAGYFPGTIKWQTSNDGVLYGDILGANTSTYTTPVLNFGQNTHYKAIITAGSAVCQSPTKYIVIANPTLLTAPDSFNCGPGSVTLTATSGGNGVPVWYSSASGGLPVGTGSPFVTPYLGATTSYWVVAGGGGPTGSITVGAGALTSGTQDVSPFAGFWGGTKSQYIIRAAELTALGIPVGAAIKSITLDVVTGGSTYPGFAISMKNTTATTVTTTYEAGTTQVYDPLNATTAVGLNTFTFTNPFVWNGSNLLIQTCWSNAATTATPSTVKMDNTTYAATHRGQSNSLTPAAVCGIVGTTASTNGTHNMRPKFVLGWDKKCETAREEVIAHIYPKPIVDLGPDVNQCVDPGVGLVLDAGVQPNGPQFLWDDNSTMQVRAVTETGNYSVKVTNMYTCADKDTVSIILRNNPVLTLGNDTTVCNGVVLTLNPGGNGIEYFWNTGASQQIIHVNSGGSYNVFVTNAQGCTSADTIIVNMQGELPSIQGIQVTNDGAFTFKFSAVNPQNVIGYEWDFGDNSAPSYEENPTHTYLDAADYTVVLRLSSTCGFRSDTLSAHIVGIHQINVSNQDLNVYPNPTQHTATIEVNGNLKMEKIEVYNVLGQLLYKKKADSNNKHLLSLNALASGIYTIQIYTDKGSVSRKLEILR